jgi:hypothetical protein
MLRAVAPGKVHHGQECLLASMCRRTCAAINSCSPPSTADAFLGRHHVPRQRPRGALMTAVTNARA